MGKFPGVGERNDGMIRTYEYCVLKLLIKH